MLYNRCAQPYFTCWTFPINATSAHQAGAAADEVAERFALELVEAAQERAIAAGADVIEAEHVADAASRLLPVEIDADGDVLFFPALEEEHRARNIAREE